METDETNDLEELYLNIDNVDKNLELDVDVDENTESADDE